MIFRLIRANLTAKPLYLGVSLLLFTLGTAIVIILQLFRFQMDTERQKNIGEIDMVIGAKGSPLQLILSTVFHADAPVGNIPYHEAEKWMRHPMVKTAVPLALGDSYQSWRIVGTTPGYIEGYKGNFQQGYWDTTPMTAVLGAEVAAKTGLGIGNEFHGAHGISGEAGNHDARSYRIKGILKPTRTILDRLILTSIESVKAVHQNHSQPDTADEITAVLVSFKGPMGALTVPRMVQQYSSMQAAVPANEWARLQLLVGDSFALIHKVATLLFILAGVSVFVTLYYAMENRQYDIAIMRVMGASRRQMFLMVIGEGLIIGMIGAALGVIAGHLGMEYISAQLRETYHYPFTGKLWLNSEAQLLALVLLTGLGAALIPAILSYRTDISKTLQSPYK